MTADWTLPTLKASTIAKKKKQSNISSVSVKSYRAENPHLLEVGKSQCLEEYTREQLLWCLVKSLRVDNVRGLHSKVINRPIPNNLKNLFNPFKKVEKLVKAG